jgi:hypothetical protein
VTLRSGDRPPLNFIFDFSTDKEGNPSLQWRAPSSG